MRTARIAILFVALAFAAALQAEEGTMSPAQGFDGEACAKHCQEMAAAHQKMMNSQKAMMEKHQAMWKDIGVELQVAKTARGDKKVAALEAALEKLVALHESMQKEMGDASMMHGGMMHGGMMHGGMMGCCAGAGMQMGMGMGMGMDCPMMKDMKAGSQTPPKPAN
jgi:hypothetical protein